MIAKCFRAILAIYAIMIWVLIGGVITIANLFFIPVMPFLEMVAPSYFKGRTKDILTFGVLRRGFNKIFDFVKYGF